jgi:hypothetical protein
MVTFEQIQDMSTNMVSFEEVHKDMTAEGALAYLLEHVFPSDTDSLLAYCEYHGISDFDDFMSFGEIEFRKPYSALDQPDILLSLSTSLIKKLLSVQSWYGYMLQDNNNDPVLVVYSLTTNTLNAWRQNEVLQRFSTEPTVPRESVSSIATSPTTSTSPAAGINNGSCITFSLTLY